jgi:UDP-N-acetyl-D-galactosamine dehydrogenase
LEEACDSLSQIISRGDIIVFESTVYPGATEELCISILEKGSNLKSNSDFFVGYSPERINVGDNEHGLANTPKIVSAQNNETLDAIYNIYNNVFNAGIIKASSIKTAEAAKMYENVQRDVLIALANQYSDYCLTEGLNIKEVTNCASTKWNFSKVYPGLVGGHCISVDPYYLLARAKAKGTDLQLIETARSINEAKVGLVAKRIVGYVNDTFPDRDNLSVLVLGFSYKKDVGDVRNTKVAELIDILSKSIRKIECYDPLVDPNEVKNTYGLNIIISQEDISDNDYDMAIIAVKHKCINNLQYKAKTTIELEDFL